MLGHYLELGEHNREMGLFINNSNIFLSEADSLLIIIYILFIGSSLLSTDLLPCDNYMVLAVYNLFDIYSECSEWVIINKCTKLFNKHYYYYYLVL